MEPAVISALLGAGASVVGTGASLLSSGNLNSRNRKWNAQQAQLNRDFQSQEAEIARQWQEDMYNQYYSPQAQIHQQMEGYKAEGINPSLMFGQNVGAGAMPSTSAPSGSQASGNFSAQSDFANIMAVAKDIAMTRAQIDNLEADSESKRAAAGLTGSQFSLNLAQASKLNAEVAKLKEETKSEEKKRGYIVAQTLLANSQSRLNDRERVSINYDIFRKEFDEAFKNRFGTYPATNLYETIWNSIKGLYNGKILGIEMPWKD